MLLSKLKQSELNQSTSGRLYSCPICPESSPSSPGKPLASHSLTSSPQTLRTASNNYHSAIIAAKKRFNTSLMLPPLQALANFGIPSTRWFSVISLLHFFLHKLLLHHCHRCLPLSSQTKFSNCIPLWSLLLPSHRLISRLKTLLPYSALSLRSLKMKCLKSSLTHLTLSLILIPFPHLSSNNAYLQSYRPWLTS